MVEDNSNPKDAIRRSPRAFCITCAAATAGIVLRYCARPVEAKDVAPKQVKLVEFSDSGQREDIVTVPMIVKSLAEWKQQLSPDAFVVTRQAGTHLKI